MLLAAGYRVRAIYRFFFGGELLRPHERLTIIKEDVRKLTREHFQGVDAVVDLVSVSNSAENLHQIGPLGEIVARAVPRDVEIEWYGDPDHRSYRVAFDRIEALAGKPGSPPRTASRKSATR